MILALVRRIVVLLEMTPVFALAFVALVVLILFVSSNIALVSVSPLVFRSTVVALLTVVRV